MEIGTGGIMSEDKIKGNMSYIGLCFSYLVILILRLMNCMPYCGRDEAYRIKALSTKIAIASFIHIILKIRKMGYGSSSFAVYSSMSIIMYGAGVYVLMLVVSFVAQHLELKLYMKADNEFNTYEERMGRRKTTYFARTLCMGLRSLCNEFPKFGWFCAIPIGMIIIVYYQICDYATAPSVSDTYTCIGFVLIIASLGWRAAAPMYSFRSKREQYQQKEEYKYKSNNNYYYSNSKNDTSKEEDPDEEYQDPIMCGYFNGCKTVSELKKQYKMLVKRMHPDAGGNVDDFQRMNNEYEYCMRKWGKKG